MPVLSLQNPASGAPVAMRYLDGGAGAPPGQPVRTFEPERTALQRQVLGLLGVLENACRTAS